MRLMLEGIQKYVTGLEFTDRVYIGKLDNKKDKSIGIYPRKTEGHPVTALGQESSYEIKPVSILVHWTKDKAETEKTAYSLFDRIRTETGRKIGDIQIQMIRLMVPEPQDAGSDDNGIYEYVIWLDFIYKKEVSECQK